MTDTVSRPNRAEEVRQERRRKPGATVLPGIKLGVDESKLDRTNYSYRLVNDTAGRVQQLEGQDWDPAPEQALYGSTGAGTVQSKHAGSIEGRPFNAVLMRKPMKMHKEDQAAKQAPIDQLEDAIKRGASPIQAKESLTGEGVYTPGAGNSIGRV